MFCEQRHWLPLARLSFQGYFYSWRHWKGEEGSMRSKKQVWFLSNMTLSRVKLSLCVACYKRFKCSQLNSSVVTETHVWTVFTYDSLNVPHKTWRTWERGTNIKVLMFVMLWVIKSFVSDPAVTCPLPGTIKLWQANILALEKISDPSQFLTNILEKNSYHNEAASVLYSHLSSCLATSWSPLIWQLPVMKDHAM